MNPTLPLAFPPRLWRHALCAAALAVLSACGGSDGPTNTIGTIDGPPTITVAPVSTVGANGGVVTFSVTVTGGNAFTYQWQLSTDGTVWADIAGATAAQYAIAAADWALNGNRYRVQVTGAGVTVTSDPATLTVACAPLQPRLDGKALYDACLDVTYLSDAALPATLPLGVAGIEANGTMNWPTAKAWIQALNASNHLGFADWRLPTVRPQNGTSFQLNGTELESHTGRIDLGHNISNAGTRYAGSTASELPFLFYNQLGGVGEYDIAGVQRTDLSRNAALPYFRNLAQPAAHWTAESYGSTGAYAFDFRFGTQYAYDAGSWRFAVLVVRDGDVGGGTGGGGGGGAVADACQPPFALPAGTRVESDFTIGTFTGTARLDVVGPAVFEGRNVTAVDVTTPLASLAARGFASWDAASRLLTVYGAQSRAASADGLNVQEVKAVATPPGVDRRYALAPGASFTEVTTNVQTETLTLNGVPQAPTTTTQTDTTTVQFLGMETITVPAGTFHACKYAETDDAGTVTTEWLMAGYSATLKSVSGNTTQEASAVRVNGQVVRQFP